MAAFKLVYRGSKSMRCAVLTVLMAFSDGCAENPFVFESDREAGFAVVTESENPSVAGSMSMLGMTTTGVEPAGCAWDSLWAPAPHQQRYDLGFIQGRIR